MLEKKSPSSSHAMMEFLHYSWLLHFFEQILVFIGYQKGRPQFRYLFRLATYKLAELQIEGDGNCQVGPTKPVCLSLLDLSELMACCSPFSLSFLLLENEAK